MYFCGFVLPSVFTYFETMYGSGAAFPFIIFDAQSLSRVFRDPYEILGTVRFFVPFVAIIH